MKNALVTLISLALLPIIDASEWDQNKAEAKVQSVLEVEKQGRAWDQIDWYTAPEQAVLKSRETNQPIFLFIYLKTKVGPPDAQC